MAGKPKELILPNHEPPAGATATRSFLGSEVLFRKHDPPSIRSDRMLLSISRAVKQTKVKTWHRPETALCPHKSCKFGPHDNGDSALARQDWAWSRLPLPMKCVASSLRVDEIFAKTRV